MITGELKNKIDSIWKFSGPADLQIRWMSLNR